MIDPQHTAALIPAAGLSSRMGQFKPLLPLGQETVLERVIQNFKTAGVHDLHVVVGFRSKDLIPILQQHRVQWIVNSDYHQGMYSSIQIGAAHLNATTKAFFLLPVDMPFVKPQTITKLLAAFEPNDMDILKPCYRGRRGHPPLISSSVIPGIQDYDGNGGLRELIFTKQLETRDLECDDPGILEDLDTRNDYERLSGKIDGFNRM